MKKQQWLALLFTVGMIWFVVVNVQADNDLSDEIASGQEALDEVEKLYEEMQNQIDKLEENKENLSDYLASLNQSCNAAQMLIHEYNTQISEKQSEIDKINQKLFEAEQKQTEQHGFFSGVFFLSQQIIYGNGKTGV